MPQNEHEHRIARVELAAAERRALFRPLDVTLQAMGRHLTQRLEIGKQAAQDVIV